MEFLHTESSKFGNQKVGLALISLLISPLEGAHIVFKTKNLTKTLSKNNDEPLSPKTNSSASEAQSPKPCLFSSYYLPPSLLFYINQTLDPYGIHFHEANSFGILPNRLPMTVCTKHGNAGFLPLEHARMLSEYTCTTYWYPIFRVIHRFEDCVLRFPPTYPLGRTPRIHFLDGEGRQYLNKCYRCSKRIRDKKSIYMYRDNPFCSAYCRYTAHVAHCLQERMRKDMEKAINRGIIPSCIYG